MVSGMIVLVGRGECKFVAKAAAAQNAGAVGVIIVNNDEANADDVIRMATVTNQTVSIPVLMVSYNNGDLIKGLGSGTSVEFKFSLSGQCGTPVLLQFLMTEPDWISAPRPVPLL